MRHEASERIVLGSLMERQELFSDASALRPEMFFEAHHRVVADVIFKMNAEGRKIDIAGIVSEMGRHRNATEKDLLDVTTLNKSAITDAQLLTQHIMLVRDAFFRRQISRIAEEAMRRCEDPIADPLDSCKAFIDAVQAMLADQSKEEFSTMQEVAEAVISETIENFGKPISELMGLPTSLPMLDEKIFGLSAPDVVVLAAGAGEGKSTLALQIATHAAKTGKKVLYFSLEMSDRQLVTKIIASKAGVHLTNFRKMRFDIRVLDRLKTTIADEVKAYDIIFNQASGLSIDDIEIMASSVDAATPVDLIVLDYLQLVTIPGFKGTREQEVTQISRRIKKLARKLEVPILSLSQVSRMKEKRLYRKSDLRESGAIEQDADVVMFINRPELNGVEEVTHHGGTRQFEHGEALLEVAKCRMGDLGKIVLRFDKDIANFVEVLDVNETGGRYDGYQASDNAIGDAPF